MQSIITIQDGTSKRFSTTKTIAWFTIGDGHGVRALCYTVPSQSCSNIAQDSSHCPAWLSAPQTNLQCSLSFSVFHTQAGASLINPMFNRAGPTPSITFSTFQWFGLTGYNVTFTTPSFGPSTDIFEDTPADDSPPGSARPPDALECTPGG